MRRVLLVFLLVALASGGCGESKAKVKGRLVSNGGPVSLGQAAVILTPVGADDKPDPSKSFTCVVNDGGSFEMVASGGELPVGRYQVSIQATSKESAAKVKAFAGVASPVRRDIKGGDNEIVVDIAKPNGDP